MCPDRPPLRPTDEFSLSAYAEWLMEWLDEKAGKCRLSDWERHVQRECRKRFLFYQPDDRLQVAFIQQLDEQRRFAEWKVDLGGKKAG